MKEYKTDCATVRIHGAVERERIEDATIRYLKGVQKCKKENLKKSETSS